MFAGNSQLIMIGLVGFVTCIAVLIIMLIRKPSKIQEMEQIQEEDFISDIAHFQKKRLSQKPWNMSFQMYTTIGVVSAVVLGIIVYIITDNLIFTLLSIVCGFAIPELVLTAQNSKQKSLFEERYARGLKQLASALKSGLTIHQAVTEVANSPFVHDQIRKEFYQLDSDLKLGISISEAFRRFAERVKSQDAADVSMAITMQSKVGGKEAQVVETIAQNISNRIMLRKEVKSMFAGSNSTIVIMDIMPIIFLLFVFIGSDIYINIFFSSPLLTIVFFFLLAVILAGSIYIHIKVNKMKKDCGIGTETRIANQNNKEGRGS